MNMQLLDVFGYQLNRTIWERTKDILTGTLKPEEVVSFKQETDTAVLAAINNLELTDGEEG